MKNNNVKKKHGKGRRECCVVQNNGEESGQIKETYKGN